MQKHPEDKPRISVIGLGKLGSCYAAFYASRGYQVVGFDTDKKKTASLRKGQAPIREPGLQELISGSAHLRAADSIKEAVEQSDITFIIVPTPSLKSGAFSVQYILDAAKEIGKGLKSKRTYHVCAVVSTVLPGDSREDIIPGLEKYSGKKCGEDFGYCYTPSLIAIGDIVRNLTEPDFLFLGSFDARSRARLEGIYQDMYPGKSIERMSIESAELAKISLNSYVTMKITFANVVGEICSRIPNANADHVTGAIGKDRRIGPAFLRSGLGYGGPCFPRDNFAFSYAGKRHGVLTPIALAVHHTNASLPKRFAQKILDTLPHRMAKVGFLSLAYKNNTTMIEESQAFEIARILIKKKTPVIVHEPLGNTEASDFFRSNAKYADSIESLVAHSDAIFISNHGDHNKKLAEYLHTTKKPLMIIDPWGTFEKGQLPDHVHHIPIGRVHHETVAKKNKTK